MTLGYELKSELKGPRVLALGCYSFGAPESLTIAS